MMSVEGRMAVYGSGGGGMMLRLMSYGGEVLLQ